MFGVCEIVVREVKGYVNEKKVENRYIILIVLIGFLPRIDKLTIHNKLTIISALKL